MAEIYRDSINKGVTFTIPSASATVTSAKIIRNGVETPVATALTSMETVVQLPYSVTRYDGKFDIEFTYTIDAATYTKRETHEVVTPLFTPTDLRRVDPDFVNVSELEINELEKLIRSLFETLTGQKFGLEKGILSFIGNGKGAFALPKRCCEPVSPLFGDGPYRATTSNDGWVVEGVANDSWILKFETNYFDYPYNTFVSGRRYYLDGLWGYYSVPEDISLAAMLLAQDYGCEQSMWQARYIKTLSLADMRFEFDGRAFSRTGNVRVDQIIDRYTRVRAGIL